MHPGAVDIPGNGMDEDCDGSDAVAGDRRIVLVAGTTAPPSADRPILARLEATGLPVTVVDDDTVAGGLDLTDVAFVALTSSVVLTKLGGSLAEIPVPLLTWEGHLHDENKLADPAGETTAFSNIAITDPAHPLAAGLSGSPTVTTAGHPLSFGVPAAGADVVAVDPRVPQRAVLFTYATGAARTDGTPAPSCRTGIFPSYFGAGALSPAGTAIVDAAIQLSMACNPPPATTGCAAQDDIPVAECQALVDLYEATNGPHWTSNTRWLDYAAGPCTWLGVFCVDGHVSNLGLRGRNLQGSLPASLGDLAALKGLELSDNLLGGPIPAELGQLSTLTDLALARNALTWCSWRSTTTASPGRSRRSSGTSRS